ncbi:hypothetical protein [Hymenobacter elongatus]|uniref:Uncharacterized protein n=1 Tax=Hymenobacter elongatus TaxID=877208 RepID=A0A4Z0PFD8_9BACT|nr:hypothetical protein [Hymenobacter elongatus]TGE13856.1 hypothetical protein E5J99_18545 [Hymenobacter elongatus]
MIKALLLLLCLLGGLSAPVLAQQESLESQTRKQRLRNQFLTNDTAQAIINLYSRRQAGGAAWIVSSALTAARLATSGGRTVASGPGYTVREEAPGVGVVLLVSAPFAAYGISKVARYSNANLEKVMTAYGAGQPLPRSLRRKLKPRFFDEPIIQYTPVQYTPVK